MLIKPEHRVMLRIALTECIEDYCVETSTNYLSNLLMFAKIVFEKNNFSAREDFLKLLKV